MSRTEKLAFLRTIKNKAGIYALLKDSHVFYVGISSSLDKRLSVHLSRHGYDIEFMLLEEIEITGEYLSDADFQRELFWISEFRRFGLELLNGYAGRKKAPYTTITMRIPTPVLEDARLLMDDFRWQMKTFGFYDESKAPVTQYS